jgi:uncharacterized protein (DUF2342 family)
MANMDAQWERLEFHALSPEFEGLQRGRRRVAAVEDSEARLDGRRRRRAPVGRMRAALMGLCLASVAFAAGAEPFDASRAIKEAGLDFAQQSVEPKPLPIRLDCERDVVDRNKIVCAEK